jgi:hypothetical protein
LCNTGSPLASIRTVIRSLLRCTVFYLLLLSSIVSTCKEALLPRKSSFDLAHSYPIWFMPSNTDAKPNYIFCQFINPELAHDGKRCTCFDIVAPKPKPK